MHVPDDSFQCPTGRFSLRVAKWAVCAAFLTLPLAACGGDGTSGAGAAVVQDSAGVRIVSNPSGGAWEAGGEWSLEEDLRIGVSSGDPELQFGNIIGVDVDAEGRIVTLDGQARRVRVFDRDGALLAAFGRSGGGPGELSQGLLPAPSGLFVDSEMSIVIPDMGNQRLARFDTEGEPLDSPSLDLTGGVPMMWMRSADRSLYQQFRTMDMTGGMPQGEMTDEIRRLDPGATTGEAVLTLPAGETFSMGAGGMPAIRIFSPEPVWTVLDDGRIVSGVSHEYSLSIRNASGDVESIVRREVRRRPVTESDERTLIDEFSRAWEEAGVPGEMLGPLREAISFEEEWPTLARLLAGPDGTLWVQLVDPDALEELSVEAIQAGDFGSPIWDVVDAEGTLLGTVVLPSGFNPVRFVDDALYGVHRDEMEVQRVMRLRLVRGEA